MDATATSNTFRFGAFPLDARGATLSRVGDDGTWKPVVIGSRALELGADPREKTKHVLSSYSSKFFKMTPAFQMSTYLQACFADFRDDYAIRKSS